MKRKIFVSINIPEKDRERLVRATEKWKELPVKWVREANLHLTLAFLGFVPEDLLEKICRMVSEASAKSNIFDITFDEIELFPSSDEPRLVALTGEANEELKDLVNNIEESLGLSNAKKKTYRPHITLGRMRKIKWEALPSKPEISEKFSLSVTAEAADIMASDFDGEGQEYTIIESCPLR